MKKETPLMSQFNKIKSKYPDAILLFRVGDFYETFGKDAIKTSKILDIILTNRSNGSSKIELAGFPYHSLDSHLPKLVKAGLRVAICDQLEDPKTTKKIVKRGVTELVTPGVSYRNTHDLKQNNFLSAIHFQKNVAGISFLDISTGEFFVSEGPYTEIIKLVQSFNPSEILYQRNKKKDFEENFNNELCTYMLEEWIFKQDYANDLLTQQFNTKNLKGFGIEELKLGCIAAGSILHYLKETKHHLTQHISQIARIDQEKFVWMDKFTIKNLDLFYSHNHKNHSLINCLDNTNTPMGSRLIKKWLALPLIDKGKIEERLSLVELFVQNEGLLKSLLKELNEIGDLERIVSKISTQRISPKEFIKLKHSLIKIISIKAICSKSNSKKLKFLGSEINNCTNIIELIEKTIQDDPPVLISKGNVIKSGVNKQLDEFRQISSEGKDHLQKILEKEIEKTGITSLKISFNNVFGYYLEVRNIHKDKVPENWIRKQTLVSAERYISEELKTYEVKILSAESKIIELENNIYNDLILKLLPFIHLIQLNSRLISKIDVLCSFAQNAKNNNYKKPIINNSTTIIIKNGRHPIIEKHLKSEEIYIPNDIHLDQKNQQIMMVTGPNMSGKSALLRQTALIVIMAQIGSFIPAEAAELGITDKIFTRVGASDNISMGESTFMVEMNETASILNNLSKRSLILLDEIGRGTSTYDGISIAWAIAEYLHENKYTAKTLFATHYHELNEMSKQFYRIKNFNVSVKEVNNKIIFIRKLEKGGSEHSFGIHVAKMAGMPKDIIVNSKRILKKLENSRSKEGNKNNINSKDDMQLSFYQLDDPTLLQIKEEILEINIDTLTPVESLMKLNEIKKLLGK
ncbi:MAG: DNA mismatch repair protein MutS [Flavobacteriales bacterium]|nr:DNA mismatch repair protein MutS [Flavobacteriales bacterium]